MPLNLGFRARLAYANFSAAMHAVFSKKEYLAVACVSSVAFAYLFVLLTSIPGQSLESWLFSTTDVTKATGAVASVLLGLITASQAYVARNYSFWKLGKRAFGSAIWAYAAALLGTACCSPFILPILFPIAGFGAAAYLIATHQVELFFFSTAMLLVSLYYSTKLIGCEECRVKVGAAARK